MGRVAGTFYEMNKIRNASTWGELDGSPLLKKYGNFADQIVYADRKGNLWFFDVVETKKTWSPKYNETLETSHEFKSWLSKQPNFKRWLRLEEKPAQI